MEENRSQPQRHEVQKGRTKDGLHAKNAAYQACRACHHRKKRCITTLTRHPCTYCFTYGYRCIPRTRLMKSARKHTVKTSGNQHQQQPSYKFDSQLPPGIDHEVPLPRWSAIHSLVSEVLRLIPPKGPQPACDGKRTSAIDEQDSSEKSSHQGENRLSRARGSQKQTPCEMNTVDSYMSLFLTPNSCVDDHPVLPFASEGGDATSVFSDLESLPRL